MKIIGVFKILAILLFFTTIPSCNNSLKNKAIEVNNRFMGANGWIYKVDADIHQYNVTHDTTLLYSSLAYLKSVPINEDNSVSWHTRILSVYRLLHKYDTVFAVLDTCQDEAFGNFGKTKELLITEISKYNYYRQFEKRDQKIDELVTYMEYCFERQKFVAEMDESRYLQKYVDNQLARCAVATEIDPYTLNWYIGIRLLRGDKKADMELLIENYYQNGYIDEIGKDWLQALLDGNYEEKDIDSRL
ncbi:MAG: hypothetical protein K6E93_09825 [Bacteroidales bacterium]|nr:hypothetical protein [Bacteroidales bacterium]